MKPWQKKTATRSNAARLDQALESDDYEDMDEPESKGGSYQTGAPGRFVEADMESYQKITLPRRRLGRWCNEPFFEDAIRDCYVKLFIGVNEEGKRCYRLCRITGVIIEEMQYALPQVKNEKPVSLVFDLHLQTRPFVIRSASPDTCHFCLVTPLGLYE